MIGTRVNYVGPGDGSPFETVVCFFPQRIFQVIFLREGWPVMAFEAKRDGIADAPPDPMPRYESDPRLKDE